MTHSLIKFAPCFSHERYVDPTKRGRSLYEKMRFLPGQKTAPLIIDHDESRVIGEIGEPFRLQWTDGWWWATRASVTDPPPWMKKGTRVSVGFKVLHKRSPDLFPDAEVIAQALVREVSVLSPGKKPAEPLAEVLTLEESVAASPRIAPRPARRTSHDPEHDIRTSREIEQTLRWVEAAPPGVLRRSGIGQVLGVR